MGAPAPILFRSSVIRDRPILLRAVLFVACILSLFGCDSRSKLNPGDAAPGFTLPLLDGGTRSLDSFKGKISLLNFWASWCEPCREELPSLGALQKSFSEAPFEVVSVAVSDTPENLQAAKSRFNIPFPILLDGEELTKRMYRVTGFPETFLLDRKGRLVPLVDPEDGSARIRIIGPRDWNSPFLRKQIEAAIAEPE